MSSKRNTPKAPDHELSASSSSNYKTEEDLRGREMSEDPMLEYFRQKEREKQGTRADRPKYKGPFPVNRFNIRPGCRWDGVNRSNGFEKKLIDRDNEKLAREEERYRMATHDL